MATESIAFQQEYEETPGKQKTKYDYTSVQTQYDPGYTEAGFEHPKRNQETKAGVKYNYKPTALRPWFLIFAAVFLLGCVVVAEYALRNEPSASQLYENTTLSRRNSLAVPAKGWLGAAWGNNLAPDGLPRARGMARMDRGDLRVVERVPASSMFAPSGLTTVRTVRLPGSSAQQSQTKEISTSVTVTTERVVLVTITPPADTSNIEESRTTTGKVQPPLP